MTSVRPFFLLLSRAAVFWLGLIAVGSAGLTIFGFSDPEARRIVGELDGAFACAVVFPLLAGWILGALIQEFQHTTFAYPLPRVGARTAAGFLLTGLIVTTIVVFAIGLGASEPHNLAMLFCVGFGIYCAAGAFVDPFSVWLTAINVAVAIVLFARSASLGRLAEAYPWLAVGIALALGARGLTRLFARSTFRRKPFKATSPFPGRFSLEKSQRFETRRTLELRTRRRRWRGVYLGTRPWAWVRAAYHQVHGARSLRSVGRNLAKAWGLGLIVLVEAWVDKGDLGFLESIVRVLHDALLRSPHVPPYGDRDGPLALVLFAIAVAGALSALFTAVALRHPLAYPLSRRQRAGVNFRGGLVDAAIFLLVVGPFLLVIGHLAGWFAGYEFRLDFMPYTTRALLVTVIAMPLGYWGRWRLIEATRQRSTNTMLGVIAGVIVFCVVVWLGAAVSAAVFPHPLVELGALLTTLVLTRWIHARVLLRHFRTADLV